MTEQKILILPGWQDSGPLHWQSLWLKKYKNSVKVIQNDWMYPEKQTWVNTLNEYIEKYSKFDLILVGHSLACATIIHWANEYYPSTSAKIKGALLVSPSNVEMPDFPSEITGFSPMPLCKLKFKTIAVTSTNDKWVSLERAKIFTESWGAELVNIGPQGHINAEAGFGEWPEGEKLLEKLLK